IVQPGHIFPLKAQDGGVLVRAGHTEAGCDLARLAGFEAAAVIVEILNEDGSMARLPDLKKVAKEHDLKIGTIADLIHHRVRTEKTVERLNECSMPTPWADFRLVSYQDVIDNELHLALVLGDINADEPVLVRVHMQNTLCDLFASTHSDCGWPLQQAMQHVGEAGAGVIVVLRNHDTAREIVQRMRSYHLQDENQQMEEVSEDDKELRTFGVGAQILADLGVRKMRVMSSPMSLHALSGFDLEVVEYVNYK
ncbi:MAG: 3,4-dihydroxy-2-butanone-4-phosphate synthase, partial [gamma proteobacterium symbiont of Bathyaustriella thionipta]|nr:3,4-dihydroxy-2-butanone-4-phosphate synthase [gamma proteobacterium symbiont of Bathyaustriella thionipta]